MGACMPTTALPTLSVTTTAVASCSALMGTGSPSSLRVSKSTPASNNTSRAAGFLPPAGLYASPIRLRWCALLQDSPPNEAPGPHAGALPTPAPIDTRKADVSALP